jgi:hypothetical protein
MNILEKIKQLFSSANSSVPITTETEPAVSMSDREDKLFEKEQLSLQKLYEQWSCKDTWLLYEEGIPLLFGLAPDESEPIDDEVSNKIESLWEHAQECVQKKLLPIVNNDIPEKEWEVRPIDLYSWGTISRISMPDEFSTLMTFVAQTIKPIETHSNSNQGIGEEDALYQKHREIVLGAATSLLVNAPELCKSNKGKIVSNKIAKNIIENEEQWFGDDKPLLTELTMTDLINEYLKLTKPLI